MKRAQVISTAVLFLLFGTTALVYALQEQQVEKQGKPEKQAQPEKQQRAQQQQQERLSQQGQQQLIAQQRRRVTQYGQHLDQQENLEQGHIAQLPSVVDR